MARRLGPALAVLACALATTRGAVAESTAESCVRASEDGQNARERTELRRAREAFAACAAATCPKLLRADCARWLEEVDRDTPTIVVGVKDARGDDALDGRVAIDGVAVRSEAGSAVRLDPGTHVVRFERPGAIAVERTIVVRMGERNRLVVERVEPPKAREPEKPPPAPRGVPTATWIFGGIGVVGLAGFGVLGAMGLSEKSQLRARCAPSCTDADVSRLQGLYIGADVSLAVSVVALGIATYFLLRGSDAAPTSSRALGYWHW